MRVEWRAMNAHHHSPLSPFGGFEDAVFHLLPEKVGLSLQRLWASHSPLTGDVSLSKMMQGEMTMLASVLFPLAVTHGQEMG